MGKEVLLIIITSICNGIIVFVFQTCISMREKKKDKHYEDRKSKIIPYCDMLYEIYQIFHVDIEPCISTEECDINGILENIHVLYQKMLQLDAYYNIYKNVIEEKCSITDQQYQIQHWLYQSIKPAMDSRATDEIIEAFVSLYNDIQPVLVEEAQALTREVLYC